MPVETFAPHPLLAAYVQSVSVAERVFAPPHACFDILPDTRIELVYAFGTPCVLQRDTGDVALPQCYALGLLDAPLRLGARGTLRTVRASLYPWGVLPLLGAWSPFGDVVGVLAASAVFERFMPTLAAALDHGNTAAANVLQHFLIQRGLDTGAHSPALVEAAQHILAQHGDLGIDDLAQRSGIAPRTLRRLFRAQFGVGPKTLARIARFEHVQRALWDNPATALAEVALSAGYADQAHMQREFQQLAQRTPRQFATAMSQTRALFAAQIGRNVQDVSPGTAYT